MEVEFVMGFCLAFASTLISRTVNATNTAIKLAKTPDKMIARLLVMTHEEEVVAVSASFALSMAPSPSVPSFPL